MKAPPWFSCAWQMNIVAHSTGAGRRFDQPFLLPTGAVALLSVAIAGAFAAGLRAM